MKKLTLFFIVSLFFVFCKKDPPKDIKNKNKKNTPNNTVNHGKSYFIWQYLSSSGKWLNYPKKNQKEISLAFQKMKKRFKDINFETMTNSSGKKISVLVNDVRNNSTMPSTNKRVLVGKEYVWKYATNDIYQAEKKVYLDLKHLKNIILESSFIEEDNFYLIKQKKIPIMATLNTEKSGAMMGVWEINKALTEEMIIGLATILVTLNNNKVSVMDLDHGLGLSDIGYSYGHWKIIDFDFFHQKLKKPEPLSYLKDYLDQDYTIVEENCTKISSFTKSSNQDILTLSRFFYKKLCPTN